jgi:hypothetical protein
MLGLGDLMQREFALFYYLKAENVKVVGTPV